MRNRMILAVAMVLILAIGLAAGSHIFESTVNIPLMRSQNKNISLPYNCSYVNAQQLRNDIVLAGGGAVNVFNWNGLAWQRYSGGGVGQINFTITPGVGYQVMVTEDVTTWNVTGTHNPAVSISLIANVKKVVSIPYTTSSTTAALLRNEIVAAGGTGVSVYDYDGATGKYKKWCGGGIGQENFAVTPGTAYVVKSTSNVSAWFPAYQ